MRFPRTTTIVPRRKFDMKKIMFNDRFGLTTAVIEGRKTMTRRVINLPEGISPDDVDSLEWGIDDNGKAYVTFYGEGGKILCDVYPKYQPGESVAVAQSYETVYGQEESEECQTGLEYFICDRDKKAKEAQDATAAAGWKNKMYVVAGLMPYRITMEGLSVERLQNISDEDCLKEGLSTNDVFWYIFGEGIDPYPDAHAAFRDLIEQVGSKGIWKENPYVFVYEFAKHSHYMYK